MIRSVRMLFSLALAIAACGLLPGAVTVASADEAETTLKHSPWLALRFEQDGKQIPLGRMDTAITSVRLAKRPFTIVLPVHGDDDLYRVTAWTDDKVFAEIEDERLARPGQDIPLPPYFGPGTGMADTDAGSGRLMLSNSGHHYLRGLRLGPDYFRHVFKVSSVLADDAEGNSRDLALRDIDGPLYLVAWFDKDGDKALDYGEYEFLVLRFR